LWYFIGVRYNRSFILISFYGVYKDYDSLFAQDNVVFLPFTIGGGQSTGINQSNSAPMMPTEYDAESELEPTISQGDLQAAGSSYIKFRNESSHTMKVYWRDHHGHEHQYKTLSSGSGYWQHTYAGHDWIVRDADHNKLKHATAGHHSMEVKVTDAHFPSTSKSDETCSITAYEHADYSGKSWVLGTGSYNQGSSTFHKDEISSISIPDGLTVKACEHNDHGGTCKTYTSSMSYLHHFNDTISYLQISGQCQSEPAPEEKCECDKGVVEMTLKIYSRSHYSHPDERIRVRQSDINGAVLYDSYDDGNPDPGLDVNEHFTFDINSPGTKVVVTVEGGAHSKET